MKFRSLREIYENWYFALYVIEPTYFKEVVESQAWKNAMLKEMQAIEQNISNMGIGESTGRKGTHWTQWVFKIKRHADGIIQHYESRLAAKGYAQYQGIDYDRTFSPVARFEMVRILLYLSSKMSWPIYHFDVKFAFLNAELEEEV